MLRRRRAMATMLLCTTVKVPERRPWVAGLQNEIDGLLRAVDEVHSANFRSRTGPRRALPLALPKSISLPRRKACEPHVVSACCTCSSSRFYRRQGPGSTFRRLYERTLDPERRAPSVQGLRGHVAGRGGL